MDNSISETDGYAGQLLKEIRIRWKYVVDWTMSFVCVISLEVEILDEKTDADNQ